MTKAKRSADPATDALCALVVLTIAATAILAVWQGNDPRNWTSFAVSASASVLILRRIFRWAAG